MSYLFRCPTCRTRRRDHGLFKQHLVASGHRVCQCGHVANGGDAYPHRPGTRLCALHEMSGLHHAARAGTSDDELAEIAAEIAFTQPGRVSRACPF